ncbi:hypothetical protein J437_LFUL007144 [Ladona fulva]|uniref:Uncharacterized protein n=1 Tax=Ladona fulva TaxID=123851 RepID=A0A8K0K6M5_LADFU|nr:hypothetical protein J437_LFUL007144 [Ladona fulva]
MDQKKRNEMHGVNLLFRITSWRTIGSSICYSARTSSSSSTPSRGIPSRSWRSSSSPTTSSSSPRASTIYVGSNDASTFQMIGMVARPHGSGGSRGSCNHCHGINGPPSPTGAPPLSPFSTLNPISPSAGPFPPSATTANARPRALAGVEVRTAEDPTALAKDIVTRTTPPSTLCAFYSEYRG